MEDPAVPIFVFVTPDKFARPTEPKAEAARSGLIHDANIVRQKLLDVALTSAYLEVGHPVTVVVAEKPWGTHYRLKGYPMENRDEFQFISDLTVRGKYALSEIGVKPALIPVIGQG